MASRDFKLMFRVVCSADDLAGRIRNSDSLKNIVLNNTEFVLGMRYIMVGLLLFKWLVQGERRLSRKKHMWLLV